MVGCTFAYYYALITDLHLLALLVAVTIFASFMPDLDSDSGLPYYLIFGFFTIMVGSASLYVTLQAHPTSDRVLIETPVVTMLLVWFIVGGIFKYFTHHRGMMHSIPAALIASTCTYLIARSLEQGDYASLMLAVGVGAGYLSHLVLDEIHSGLNLDGSLFHPKRSLGSALKFFSSSRMSNVMTYVTLFFLLFTATNG
jgi:membrane-bound metal-dependent hydrolase YbcI (DUF457 family)